MAPCHVDCIFRNIKHKYLIRPFRIQAFLYKIGLSFVLPFLKEVLSRFRSSFHEDFAVGVAISDIVAWIQPCCFNDFDHDLVAPRDCRFLGKIFHCSFCICFDCCQPHLFLFAFCFWPTVFWYSTNTIIEGAS